MVVQNKEFEFAELLEEVGFHLPEEYNPKQFVEQNKKWSQESKQMLEELVDEDYHLAGLKRIMELTQQVLDRKIPTPTPDWMRMAQFACQGIYEQMDRLFQQELERIYGKEEDNQN